MKNYRITVNGRVYDVTVEESAGLTEPVAAPAPVVTPVPAQKPVAPAPKAVAAPKAPTPSSNAEGSVKVNSPMPGKIISIKAQVGQEVKKGQAILILEAMKMENEIVAPQDGILASVNVTEGQSVEAGNLLASLN